MGQLALGFRSLFLKLAIFVVLAAMLAAALGGSLLPRPRVHVLPAVTAGDGSSWAWRLTLTGRKETPFAWRLVRQAGAPDQEDVVDEGAYEDVAGPVAGEGVMSWGVRRQGTWWLEQRLDSGLRRGQSVPDRLALEWALARGVAGLAPGNAAELAEVREAAERGAWPTAPAGGS